MIDHKIEARLRSLGLSSVYLGYVCLVHAILLVQEDRQRLELPTKWLYPDVARCSGIAPTQVDSALRSAIRRCFQTCPDQAAALCGSDPDPSVARFIGCLVDSLQGSDR